MKIMLKKQINTIRVKVTNGFEKKQKKTGYENKRKKVLISHES